MTDFALADLSVVPPVELTRDDDGFLVAPEVCDDVVAERMLVDLRRHRRHIIQTSRQHAEWTAELDRQVAERRRELDDWLADRIHGDVERAEAIERALKAYARLLDEDRAPGGPRTWKLPSGTIVARGGVNADGEPVGTGKIEVTDAEAFVKWAQAVYDHLLRVTVSPAVSEIKAKLMPIVAEVTDDAVVYGLWTADSGERAPGVALVKSTVAEYTVEPKP